MLSKLLRRLRKPVILIDNRGYMNVVSGEQKDRETEEEELSNKLGREVVILDSGLDIGNI